MEDLKKWMQEPSFYSIDDTWIFSIMDFDIHWNSFLE